MATVILNQIYEQVGTLIWLTACLSALVLGRAPERLVASVLLADLASVVLLPGFVAYDHVRWWVMAGDAAVLATMMLIARRLPRPWLTAAIGFQFLSVLAHVPRMIDPRIHSWAYATVTVFCGYAVVAALATGAVVARFLEGSHANA